MSKWKRSAFKDVAVPSSASSTVARGSGKKRPLTRSSTSPNIGTSDSNVVFDGFKHPFPPSRKVDLNSEPWIDLFPPSSASELAVNAKKVNEVRAWLTAALDPTKAVASRLCLLTGPSGCGKTATVMAVAKEFNVSVREWTNSSEIVQFDDSRSSYGEWNPVFALLLASTN